MLGNRHILYNNSHRIDVSYKNGLTGDITVFIQVAEINNILEIKLRDTNEHSFNYTTRIDWSDFEKIKSDQSLEISYEEFKLQIVELLKQTLVKEMLIKLEANDNYCKIIFYEKSRIKSLIFLVIDLQLTDQREIIDEMANSIVQLKEMNKKLSGQLALTKNELNEKDISLNGARKVNYELEKQFCQNLQVIENSIVRSLCAVEKRVSEQLQKINLRHLKLLCDVERVKSDNKLKGESSTRLVQSLQFMRLESDKHYQTIRNLQMEVDNLNMLRTKSEKACCDLRQTLARKDIEISDLQKEIGEIRKDMKDATVIIAQKTKTHDELAKDLVQANTMIVNFNHHIDSLSEELENIKSVLEQKEKEVVEQSNAFKRLSEEYTKYKEEYKSDEVRILRHDLLLSKQRIEELEKQNREAAKLNGILTKKLAQGDFFDYRTMNWNSTNK